ncbi:hypothetical protein Efla_001519 [Eimeria flavescens]
MVCPSHLLLQEVASLRQTYSPFAEFAASEPCAAAAAAAGGHPRRASTLQQQQQQQQWEPQQQFICAMRHSQGSLLLRIGLEQEGLRVTSAAATRAPHRSAAVSAAFLFVASEPALCVSCCALLQLLQLDCLPGATPLDALSKAHHGQQREHQQQQQQQQQLESWGVHTLHPPAAFFETFEGLLQAVCPTEFQRMQQELLLRQFQLQQP